MSEVQSKSLIDHPLAQRSVASSKPYGGPYHHHRRGYEDHDTGDHEWEILAQDCDDAENQEHP
jgi:hypothetical protein